MVGPRPCAVLSRLGFISFTAQHMRVPAELRHAGGAVLRARSSTALGTSIHSENRIWLLALGTTVSPHLPDHMEPKCPRRAHQLPHNVLERQSLQRLVGLCTPAHRRWLVALHRLSAGLRIECGIADLFDLGDVVELLQRHRSDLQTTPLPRSASVLYCCERPPQIVTQLGCGSGFTNCLPGRGVPFSTPAARFRNQVLGCRAASRRESAVFFGGWRDVCAIGSAPAAARAREQPAAKC